MSTNEDILDDMDGLKDPPPPKPPKKKKETDESLAGVFGLITIVALTFVFAVSKGSKSNNRQLDMERINRMVESTRENSRQLQRTLESFEAIERSLEFNRNLDSIRKAFVESNELEK